MELFWYMLAAIGAGVGTGLAGLSAATVMVPILIVLCPSFAGTSGPYQATAIALASDILASAVASYTYAKNGNIDLKRGWIMLVCVLSMCAVGSYVAFLAGDVVLGNFTLFLTFAIGIRFLLKPDSSQERQARKGLRLDAKAIAISVFFGLTIGFGAGFVGTGGGMMMLVVFTAFLGMELKTAVGISTFIMTFTALIASVAHMLIDPAIVLEKWGVLLICVAVTTISSLLSARFANRVSNRTVGLSTGAVLTLLGGSMLLLKYWPQLAPMFSIAPVALLGQTLQCLGRLALYIIPCVLVLLALRVFTRVPSFVFRKLLHMVAFSCFVVMLLSAQSWQSASLTCVVVAAVVYPPLALAEKSSWYEHLFVQKSPGEIKRSLLMLFFMFAGVITLAWGACGKPFVAAAAILMWGVGDAAAALVGIPFGRHKVMLWPVRGKKSLEGTAAMLVASLVVGLVLLAGFAGYAPVRVLPSVVLAALVGTITELCSPSEWDTVTVPVAVLAVLLPLL